MTAPVLMLAMAAWCGAALAQTGAADAIPYPLEPLSGQGKVTMSASTLTLAAGARTDLYANTDGTKVADTVPRVLFTPKGDFIFSAKVSGAFAADFDGGSLIVYGDKTLWAKLLFERLPSNKAVIATTITKGVGDDAHHGAREGEAVYLKIARRNDTYVFYTSSDGKNWNMVRTFGMPAGTPLKVGFAAQSATGSGFTAQFSEISYRPVAFKNYWHGE